MDFPIRINKYLKEKGYTSRRQADRFIEEGRVRINGKKAVLGQQVNESDTVDVDGTIKKAPQNYSYMLFNKPKGVVSVNAQREEKEPENIAPELKGLSPVGRLDKESRGLMLFTDDGRIVHKLLSPDFEHEKQYRVRVNKELKLSFANKMEKGVDIEGYITKPARVHVLDDRRFSIAITEGKKHQIRRMATALGYEIQDLKRVRIMNLCLHNLPEGKTRKLTREEVEILLKKLHITNPTDSKTN